MSMKPAALAAVMLVTTAPGLRAAGITDGTSNTIMFTERYPNAPAAQFLKAPGLPWMRYDLVPRAQGSQRLIGVSHSAAGLAVHSGGGASEGVSTLVFFLGGIPVGNAPFTLRDRDSGQVTLPSAGRAVAVDPSDPSGRAVLLSAGHVALPATNEVRGVHFLRDASGEAVLVDYDLADGTPRRTPLGITPPIGSTKGSVVAATGGRAWATVASPGGVALFELGDLAGPGALQPRLLDTLPVGASFDPESTDLGIIAVLIGLVAEPAPSISVQEGSRLRLYVHEGAAFRLAGEQGLAPGARGIIEEEGIFFYYLSQGTLWRGVVGGGPGSVVNLGR
jgi:hypothetical protein